MSARRGYYFASAAQWATCVVDGADRTRPDAPIRPLAPFDSSPSATFAADGARAPAYTRMRETLWRDGQGALHRLAAADRSPETAAAPAAIAGASRLVATPRGLWAAIPLGHTVECFDAETLARRLAVDLPDARVIDLAGDGRDGIFALVGWSDGWGVVHVDGAGTVDARVALENLGEPGELAYLRRAKRLVVLRRDGTRLVVFGEQGGAPERSIALTSVVPCFVGHHVASDPRDRVFVAGVDHRRDPTPVVLVLDDTGVKRDRIPLREPATGLAAARDVLLVASDTALRVFRVADVVPDSAGEVEATVVTPMLQAPDVADGRRWLRVEASAALPAGTSLDVVWVATDDAADCDALLALARDPNVPAAWRIRRLRAAAASSAAVTLHGSDALATGGGGPLAVPLHDVGGRYLWVAVSLAASAGARLPVLTRLAVLHSGDTLMRHLPAIYQRQEAEPGSFVRALVGVLETTTQDLDARIAQMDRNVHPAHAPASWLDYLARWLGLPWDDALDPEQKRRLVTAAERLAQARGTRAGLEALLDCLLDGARRYRIVDATVEHGFVRLGGGACRGVALPAILGGPPASSARLDGVATLGRIRLPCPGRPEEDATSRFVGHVRVDVAATADERVRWDPWLARLVAEMVPVGARARVRWTTASALRGDRLGEDLLLEDEPAARLGGETIVGRVRLRPGGATLPTSTFGDGPILE